MRSFTLGFITATLLTVLGGGMWLPHSAAASGTSGAATTVSTPAYGSFASTLQDALNPRQRGMLFKGAQCMFDLTRQDVVDSMNVRSSGWTLNRIDGLRDGTLALRADVYTDTLNHFYADQIQREFNLFALSSAIGQLAGIAATVNVTRAQPTNTVFVPMDLNSVSHHVDSAILAAAIVDMQQGNRDITLQWLTGALPCPGRVCKAATLGELRTADSLYFAGDPAGAIAMFTTVLTR